VQAGFSVCIPNNPFHLGSTTCTIAVKIPQCTTSDPRSDALDCCRVLHRIRDQYQWIPLIMRGQYSGFTHIWSSLLIRDQFWLIAQRRLVSGVMYYNQKLSQLNWLLV